MFRIYFCIVGIILSGYALYVEHKLHQDEDFVALCDLADNVSCSNVFRSSYGRGFGLFRFVISEDHPLNLPNSVFGIAFYALECILLQIRGSAHVPTEKINVCLSAVASLGSVYLIYVLMFILEDYCLLCFSAHIINFTLLFRSLHQLRIGQKHLKSE